jgi:hypothetical protein
MTSDEWRELLDAGQCFVGWSDQAAGGAGNRSQAQLFFNPTAASPTYAGKSPARAILVKTLIFSASVATDILIALTVGGTQLTSLASGGLPLNNALIASGGSGIARQQNNTPGLVGSQILHFKVPASQSFQIAVPSWLAKLAPNQGIIIANATPNQDLNANFIWAEL